MNGQRASTPYWVQLFEARDWPGLETWAFSTDHRAALLAFWDRLNAEIPKETRLNGAEEWKTHVHPSRAPAEWKGAARLLEDGELEALVLGGPETYAALWDRELSKIRTLIAGLKNRPEVTQGDRARSRAAYIERVEANLEEIRLQTVVALQQIGDEQPDGGGAEDALPEPGEDEDSPQEWLGELIAAVALSAFWAGLDLRAAAGKEVEAFAVTGGKVRAAAKEGQAILRAQRAPKAEEICEFMRQRMKDAPRKSDVFRSAAREFGGKPQAYSRMWYRTCEVAEKKL